MSESQTLTDQAVGAAKQLAPWRSSLPWWVVLIEGVALGIIGLLVLLDPQKANVRVGLIISLGLLIAGVLQSWMLMREKAPESVDGVLGARAALGVFSGLLVLWLYVGDDLTASAGLLILGLGSLLYGLLGIFLVFNSLGGKRTSALIETVVFSAFGLLALYSRSAGAEAITTIVSAAGWVFLLGGIGLAIYSFLRRDDQTDAEEAVATISTSAAAAMPPAGTTKPTSTAVTPKPTTPAATKTGTTTGNTTKKE